MKYNAHFNKKMFFHELPYIHLDFKLFVYFHTHIVSHDRRKTL